MQKKIAGEANSYVTINDLLFKIVQYKESGKWVHDLPLVIPEKYEAHIMNMYHNSLVAMHLGPYKTFLTIRKQFHFLNILPKLQRYIEACTICQRSKPKRTAQQPYYGRIPVDYIPCENLAVYLKSMPKGFLNYEHLLIATCEKTSFVYAIPLQNKKTQTIAEALIHRVFLLTGPPTKLSIDQDSALTSQVITEVLKSLELQALELQDKNKILTSIETFNENDIVYLLAPHASALQSNAQKFRQDYVGPLAIDTKIDDTHYHLKNITGRTLQGDYHINRLK